MVHAWLLTSFFSWWGAERPHAATTRAIITIAVIRRRRNRLFTAASFSAETVSVECNTLIWLYEVGEASSSPNFGTRQASPARLGCQYQGGSCSGGRDVATEPFLGTAGVGLGFRGRLSRLPLKEEDS